MKCQQKLRQAVNHNDGTLVEKFLAELKSDEPISEANQINLLIGQSRTLMFAIKKNNKEIVKLILEHIKLSANIEKLTKDELSPYSTKDNRNAACMRSHTYFNPLNYAIDNENSEIAEMILEHLKDSPEILQKVICGPKDSFGHTFRKPLIFAIQKDNAEIVKLILKFSKGFLTEILQDTTPISNQTPLHLAISKNENGNDEKADIHVFKACEAANILKQVLSSKNSYDKTPLDLYVDKYQKNKPRTKSILDEIEKHNKHHDQKINIRDVLDIEKLSTDQHLNFLRENSETLEKLELTKDDINKKITSLAVLSPENLSRTIVPGPIIKDDIKTENNGNQVLYLILSIIFLVLTGILTILGNTITNHKLIKYSGWICLIIAVIFLAFSIFNNNKPSSLNSNNLSSRAEERTLEPGQEYVYGPTPRI